MTAHVVFTDSPTEDTITAGIDFAAELDAYALKASPAFTGTPTAPTATLGTNTTQLATCAFVQAAAAAIDLTAYAPKASPTFTGTPAAPTATLGTNTTQLATCAFVQAAVAAIDLTPYAPKASPTFTGTPAAPTATPGTNTTQLATCAYVEAAITALGSSGGAQIAYKNAENLFTVEQCSTYAGAASKTAAKLAGALFTGGTGTTTFPQFLQQPSGVTGATSWSTSGTFWGVNAATGFVGNFFDFHINGGASVVSMNYNGVLTCTSVIAGTYNLGATGYYCWYGRARILSPADSVVLLQNQANNNFDRLQFGGTTSSFPALKRSSAALQCRLADDSAYADLYAATHYFTGGATPCLRSTTAITSGAGAATGTLTNAPSAGNPTCWLPINDNGTTRYIPAW